ncbi:ABC transporter permease [Nocardioides nanhaiensis]|uniref:ABC transporter permease n=1 Tax=Nocardioides nanhaiensis TaxID=1476871 RepID=A0ABP8VU87_9ACTN
MTTSPTTSTPTPTDPRRVRGLGGVRIVLRRELSTKLMTTAFLLSTGIFAALALAGPLLMGGGDEERPTLGYTSGAESLATAVGQAGGESVQVEQVSAGEARAAVEEGRFDAVLTEGPTGPEVIVETSLDPTVGALLSSTASDQALRDAAAAAGVDPTELQAGAADPAVVALGSGLDTTSVLVALGFAAGAVVVVLLWGIPLATDVMQEKVSRVVEILLTSIRPWQLLAGKVLATTVLGLTQLVLVLGATAAGLGLAGGLPRLEGVDWSLVAVSSACLLLAIVTCCALMAGLAARVERQEDLSSALQPALAVALLPLVAAVYLAFEFADSPWLDLGSMVPVLNVFVMPARIAVEGMPLWQVAASLAVAALTAAVSFVLAGRIYAGSVLRSGGRVRLREALQRG